MATVGVKVRTKRACIVVGLTLCTCACAPRSEVVPIIHVSPGVAERLMLRPPAPLPAPSGEPSRPQR